MRLFLHTRIDLTGHLWIQVEGERKKMYILLFTCLNIRAIHLKLIKDMSIHSVILALVRFFNLYGVPSHIYLDNARAFVTSCNLGKHFTVPLYSAWFRSVWERLIKSVKCCLFNLVVKKSVEHFEFLSLLSDVQNTINSRPIGVQKMLGWTLLRLLPFSTLTSILHFSWEIQKWFMSWSLLPEKLCWSVWRPRTSISRNSMTCGIRNTCWA